MIPIHNMESVGIRKLCSEEEIEKLLRELDRPTKNLSKNWKIRYEQNLELMNSGSISQTAKVLARLNNFSQTKAMGVKDQELYQRAREFLISVVSAVKDISNNLAAELVDARL